MATEFSREFFSANRIVKADLRAARQPREDDIARIKAEVKKLYDATEVLLNITVDESLLSGYVLQIGDRVFDNSGRHALDQMMEGKPSLATLKTRVEDYKPAATSAEVFQCSEPCCQETYDNEELVCEMVQQQKDMRVPTELVPHCPYCGKPMTMNLRADNTFVQDEGWHQAAERYSNFLRTCDGLKTLYLELGVGYNTPGIIKYSFWQMTLKNHQNTYACLNYGQAECPNEIRSQAICINSDIGEVLEKI